jgi:hypothetical protein
MNEALQWVQLLVSGGMLVAFLRGLVIAGRVLQRQDEHERRLNAIDAQLNRGYIR